MTRRLIVAMLACMAIVSMSGWMYSSCAQFPEAPAEAPDYSGGDANAALECGDKRKDNLKNEFHHFLLEKDPFDLLPPTDVIEIFHARVVTDWGYRPDKIPCAEAGKVRWRNSTPQFFQSIPVGSAWNNGRYWHTSQCYDFQRQCLTRLDGQGGWNFIFKGIGFNGYQNYCIGTRIGRGGDHHRNVYDRDCDHRLAAGAKLGEVFEGETVDAFATKLSRSERYHRKWDRENWTIDDFIGERRAQAIYDVCQRGFGRRCKRMMWKAYMELSPAERRRAARLMRKTARKHGVKVP